MQKQAIPKEPVASYKEIRIGKTLYRVTSVFPAKRTLAGRWSSLRCAAP